MAGDHGRAERVPGHALPSHQPRWSTCSGTCSSPSTVATGTTSASLLAGQHERGRLRNGPPGTAPRGPAWPVPASGRRLRVVRRADAPRSAEGRHRPGRRGRALRAAAAETVRASSPASTRPSSCEPADPAALGQRVRRQRIRSTHSADPAEERPAAWPPVPVSTFFGLLRPGLLHLDHVHGHVHRLLLRVTHRVHPIQRAALRPSASADPR